MVDFLSDDTLEYSLSFLDYKEIKRLNLVSRQWNDVLGENFWQRQCILQNKWNRNLKKPLMSFKEYFFKVPVNENLIKNNEGQLINIPNGNEWKRVSSIPFWEITQNGGDGWCVEQKAHDCPGNQSAHNFASSYGWCSKRQMIDLISLGFTKEILDENYLNIYCCDYYKERHDCGSYFCWSVKLLDENQNVIDSHQQSNLRGGYKSWSKVEHTFTNSKGVRFIEFSHSGKDLNWWAGHYGAKVTGSTVKLIPKE